MEKRKVQSARLDTEIEDMKSVIARLTDARIILNRYFSVHYENFTEDEKKLIAEIEGNVFPGYYSNNPVIPDVNTQEEKVENVNKPNINVDEIARNNNSGYRNNRNTGKILSAEEYENYQERKKESALPQLSSNVMQSQNKYARNYVGPDDDYWYEKKK